MQCLWVGCSKEATKPQIAKNGEQWTNLCDEHDAELDFATESGPRRMLSAWVKAQGGHKKAADRMMKGSRLFSR